MLNKKFIGLLFILFGLTMVYIGNVTYSKYKDKVEGTTNIQIASWNIAVNTEYINNKLNLTNDIQPVFEGNEYIKAGVLAPGAVGYYDIIIDGTLSDVSFNYIIEASNSIESTIADLVITSYIINPDTSTTFIDYTVPITGIINPDDEIVTIRIYITWDDSISSSMDNATDTAAIIDENVKALITNTIEFNQVN